MILDVSLSKMVFADIMRFSHRASQFLYNEDHKLTNGVTDIGVVE